MLTDVLAGPTWRHMITAVVPGEPGQPVAVSITCQLIGYDRYGTPEPRELQQVHLEQVPAGTGLREVAARVADLHAVAARQEESLAAARLLVDTAVLGSVLPDLLGRH